MHHARDTSAEQGLRFLPCRTFLTPNYHMRIIVAGPPKTGNVWIENILATIYQLNILRPPNVPLHSHTNLLREFIRDGKFRDDTIFHQHFSPSVEFFELVASVNCHVVTTIRNPYDVFVSLFYYVQTFKVAYLKSSDAACALVDKDITHPDTLEYLATHFSDHVSKAIAWVDSKRSLLIRYEDLHEKPLEVVKHLTDQIQPVDSALITRALKQCEADQMRKSDPGLAKHIRSGRMADWPNHLTEAHLAVFESYYADAIAKLGYDVVHVPKDSDYS